MKKIFYSKKRSLYIWREGHVLGVSNSNHITLSFSSPWHCYLHFIKKLEVYSAAR